MSLKKILLDPAVLCRIFVVTNSTCPKSLKGSLTKGYHIIQYWSCGGKIGSRAMWNTSIQLYQVRLEAKPLFWASRWNLRPPCLSWSGILLWTCQAWWVALPYNRIAPKIIKTLKPHSDDNVGTRLAGGAESWEDKKKSRDTLYFELAIEVVLRAP